MTTHKPDISQGRNFSAIWLIPIIAVLIGIALVIQVQMSEGPSISISFETAEGLEAGKTKVKLLDVEIGLVEDIVLLPDMSGVNVSVKLDKTAKGLLREDTQFWVVTARIGGGNVSGLGTLLSGAYIELAPGKGKPGKRTYKGLETPPQTPVGAPGVRLRLFSEKAGSVSTGDAVLYNGYKVGRVEGVQFDEEEIRITYDIFIDAPFDDLVTSNTRFWNISGFSLSAGADGIEVDAGSMDTILLGGISFMIPQGLPAGEKVANGTEFELFNNQKDMLNRPFKHRIYYVVSFKQSIRGLLPGAPVDYRGIQVGHVERILLKEFINGDYPRGSAIPVLISVEPGMFELEDSRESIEFFDSTIDAGVSEGLRATLETGNLLTGSLYVAFDYYEDAEPAEIKEFSGYKDLPSLPSGLGRIQQQIGDLLSKLNDLPLETTVNQVNDILGAVEKLVDDPDTRQMTAELNATLAELRAVMQGLSPQLNSSVSELNQTLSNLEELTRTLADKPNALVLPTDFPADPEPEAKP